jgi:hypothetical protein
LPGRRAAHFVFFGTGHSFDEIKAMPFHVRLVRSKQPGIEPGRRARNEPGIGGSLLF